VTAKKLFWNVYLLVALFWLLAGSAAGQNRPVRVAYSAISAGIGGLWLTHEQGIFKKHGLDSSLIYFRSGTTAAQALLAGEIDFGHLAPGPMMAAWVQGADFVWIGTTVHKMVFTLVTEPAIMRGESLKGKKIGITRIGSAADLAARAALEHFGLNSKDVSLISMGGIPDILTGLRAGAVQAAILSPPFSTAALDLGYRRLLFIPDLGKEFTFSGIAAKRDYVNGNPNVARAFMTALTEGAKVYAEDSKAALNVLKRYAKVEKESILEAGYREYASALTNPPYPSLKGLEAVRQSLAESSPALKNTDLKKFIDDRFVKAR
jgi:NitT/TauT family transport system substrate-binding protein